MKNTVTFLPRCLVTSTKDAIKTLTSVNERNSCTDQRKLILNKTIQKQTNKQKLFIFSHYCCFSLNFDWKWHSLHICHSKKKEKKKGNQELEVRLQRNGTWCACCKCSINFVNMLAAKGLSVCVCVCVCVCVWTPHHRHGIMQHFGIWLSQKFGLSVPAGAIKEQTSDVHTWVSHTQTKTQTHS